MPTSNPPSPKPNAPQTTRIRDNQRRSRARRKEYLSSLESKLSHCERVGVEASVEIQNAARKVLEENRRLRGLLREFGVVEDGASGRVLEGLLAGGGRRSCGGGDGRGHENGAVTATGRPVSIASRAMPSPSSSSSNATMTYRPSPQENAAGPPVQPNRDVAANDTRKTVLNENAKNKELTAIAPMPTFAQADFSPDPDLAAFPPPKPNCSSCKSVATAIRSIRPDIGIELEADLGCQIDGSEDCSVPNTMAFDVIDRYSDGRG